VGEIMVFKNSGNGTFTKISYKAGIAGKTGFRAGIISNASALSSKSKMMGTQIAQVSSLSSYL